MPAPVAVIGSSSGIVTENVEPWPSSLVDRDVAAEQDRQLPAERQAQAGAAQPLLDRRVHLHEVLEQRAEVLGGDADAGVGDGRSSRGRPSTSVAVTRTSPSGVNFSAFEMKLRRICDSFLSSV